MISFAEISSFKNTSFEEIFFHKFVSTRILSSSRHSIFFRVRRMCPVMWRAAAVRLNLHFCPIFPPLCELNSECCIDGNDCLVREHSNRAPTDDDIKARRFI